MREFKRDYWLLYNYDKTNMDSHLLTSSANAIIKRLTQIHVLIYTEFKTLILFLILFLSSLITHNPNG